VTAEIANYGCVPVLRGRRIQAKQIGNLSEPRVKHISKIRILSEPVVREVSRAAEVSREARAYTHKAVVSIGEFHKSMQDRIL